MSNYSLQLNCFLVDCDSGGCDTQADEGRKDDPVSAFALCCRAFFHLSRHGRWFNWLGFGSLWFFFGNLRRFYCRSTWFFIGRKFDLGCDIVWFRFNLEWSADINRCRQRSRYVFRLSPRERTSAASPILEAIGPVERAVLAFDMQFGCPRPGVVAGQFDAFAVLAHHVVSEAVGSLSG